MLPCGRGTLLVKSAGFKKIPEDIQIKHETHAQIYPNIIQNTIRNSSQKWCRKILKNIIKNTTNLAISGSHFGACCMIVSRCGAFFTDLFFGTFAGTPAGDFGHLLKSFWPSRARLNHPFWNDLGIQRRFLTPPSSTCQSSKTVG